MMKKRIMVTLLSAMLTTGSLTAMTAENFGDAFTKGGWKLSFRYRLELVDQEPFSSDATASTIRTRLNYTTADWRGLSLFAEFDYINAFFGDDYNQGGGNTPDRAQFPVVADPAGDDWNQAFLQYDRGKSQFRAGRQRIIFDNARFVGNVGWRQNEQTYDALSFSYSVAKDFNFTWAYVDNVNRIFGNDVPAGDHSQSTHLVNVSKSFEAYGKLTAYLYDIDNKDVASLSNTTWGGIFDGAGTAGDIKLGYTLEYARQTDNANNITSYDADYWRLDLSAKFKSITVYGGFESLEGNDALTGQSFRTPLATLHAFNGWADKFLITPRAGLNDAYVGAKGTVGAWSWNVIYHDFSAQSGPGNYGSEVDVSLSRPFLEKYGLLLKAADFDPSSTAYGDTTKFWLQLTAAF